MSDFPVDDATLAVVWQALHPEKMDPDATQTSLWPTLEMLSMMAPDAELYEREYESDDGSTKTRLVPGRYYTDHSVIEALIVEVRRLRGGAS